MKRSMLVLSIAFMLGTAEARAEYVEIQASEIVTIAAQDSGVSPRILVKWALPEGLDTKIIDGAAVDMKVPRESKEPLEVDVFPLTRTWNAVGANWSEGWSKEGGDYADSLPSPAIATEKNGGRITANVYDFVQDQIAGRRSNFGFIVIPNSGATTKLMQINPNDAVKLADAKLIIAFRERR